MPFEELGDLVILAKKSLEVQEKILDLTAGVHKELRALKVLMMEKIPG